MRLMRLTTPHMHGEDVKRFQRAVNARLDKRRPDARVEVDGEYGPKTRDAAQVAAYLLGELHTDSASARQSIVLHPERRTPYELARARKRMRAERARQAAGGDLKRAKRWALAQVGTSEHPAGSNTGPKIDDWQRAVGIYAAPWCGAFAHAVCRAYGVDVTSDVRYVPAAEAHARRGTGGFERWVTDHAEAAKLARAGRLLLPCYDFDHDGTCDHIGGVLFDVVNGRVDDVEGNTSNGPGGSQSNGGTVAHRTDRTTDVVKGYVLVRKP